VAPGRFIYCLVPASRADTLLEPLRAHFADDPHVTVLVERRKPEARQPHWIPGTEHPRRRAPAAERDLVRALPPRLRRDARHLRFVQRLEPVSARHQETTPTDLVHAIREGDAEAASELWWRFAERIQLRVRARLGEAAAATAERTVLGRILDELDDYDPHAKPLPAWLDDVVDRYALEVGTST
jgi:hypothetical protein